MKFKSVLVAPLLAIFLAAPAPAKAVDWQKITDLINGSTSHRYDGSDVPPARRKALEQFLKKTFDEQRQEVYEGLSNQAERTQASFIPLIVSSKDKSALPLLHKMFEQGHDKYDYLGAQIIDAVATIGGASERPFIAGARRDANVWTRLATAKVLGNFSTDHEALCVLTEMLGRESDYAVRREIITSMSNFTTDPWAEQRLKDTEQEEKATLKSLEHALAKLRTAKSSKTSK